MGVAPARILELVEQFHRNRDEYRKHGLNETQLRREYLDPFFEALGWDVANRQGHAPAYREVIHEDTVKIGGVEKAPDYSFRIGGTRKFFVEAKNPAVNLKDNPAPAYQLRRYAWSAKLPLSILTDFEEFVVYDCRVRPATTDKTSAHRSLYLTYDQYESKWDEIASIFAKEAVLKGSFDKYAATDRKRGTATVDAEFLAEIEDWREMLAKNLAVRNRKLSVHDLNFAVQRTIDRIIFLRICEDRGAEHYGQLQALLNGEHTYGRLKQLFRQADDRYNSGIFHFQREKDRAEAPDELTLNLVVDDKVLKDIIERLYAPKSPYEFSVFPAEILGQVYEQFLGKVIRLTAGHQAKVEEKPEVKKAGGVYYTPAYIVDYIVKQTVGKLCEDKTPKQIEKLHILDPACGSGSFLIGAYEQLLTYHRDWYVKDGPDKHKKELYQTPQGDWRLTTQEKKRILLNNLYGVDIDPQAVEVTKLSLLLKVLEGESDETLKRQLSFIKERALPDLGQNIKGGNSLIGPDYFTGKMFPDEEEMRRINPFDWQAGFAEIMKAGGFDAVIGNPPYVFGGNYGIDSSDKLYFKNRYESGIGKVNLFALFIEKALKLSRQGGLVSFIIPNTFLRVTSYAEARRFVLENSAVSQIIDLGSGVFVGATTSSIIVVLKRVTDPSTNKVIVQIGLDGASHAMPQRDFLREGYVFNIRTSSADTALLSKLDNRSITLGNLCAELIFGVVITKNRDEVVSTKSRRGLKPFLEGKDISRYVIRPTSKYLLYEPHLLHRPRTSAVFEAKEKLLIQRITGGARPLNAAYDAEQHYNKESINNLILRPDVAYDIKYILGLLNSSLINWFYKNRFTNESKLTVNLSKEYLAQIPIRVINFSGAADKAKHDHMVSLVERMLDLHKRLVATKNPNDRTRLESQINATDRDIDRLVYDLYGLTDDEIAIVESRGR